MPAKNAIAAVPIAAASEGFHRTCAKVTACMPQGAWRVGVRHESAGAGASVVGR